MRKSIEDLIKENAYTIETADGDHITVIDVEDVKTMMLTYSLQEKEIQNTNNNLK